MLQPGLAQLAADPQAAAAAADAFSRLKPVCAQLLSLRSDPRSLTAALQVLADTLDGCPTAGLQRCFDYITYPLLFMLEAAVALRAPADTTGGSSGGSRPQPKLSAPAMQAAAAVEALLACVLVLLTRCRGLEPDQLMPLLQHVGALLQLPREQLPEEVRLKCLKVLQAALQGQQKLPRQQQLLQQAPAGAMLGSWLITTCLAAAEAEVAAGPVGTKAVRQAAVQVLGAVVAAMGPGPHLAFALPGLASWLSKQLLASVPPSGGMAVTGAAAGSSGTVLVLKTLASVIQLTLGDAAVAHIPHTPQQQQQQPQQVAALESTSDVLDALQQLSLQASGATAATTGSRNSSSSSLVDPSQPSAAANQQQQKPGLEQPLPPLTVRQDAAWLAASASKVQTLLAMVLPRLLSHTQPAVRQALAEVTAGLLQQCSRALHSSSVALTEILLTLANDDYEQVAKPAIRYLQLAGLAAGGTQPQEPLAAPAADDDGDAAAAEPPAALRLGDVSARLRKAAAAAAAAGSSASTAVGEGEGGAGAHPTWVRPAPATGARGPGRLPSAQASSALVLPDLLVGLCLQLPGCVRQNEASGIAAAKRTAAALLCAGGQLVSSSIISRAPVLQQVCAALVATFAMDPTGAVLLLRADAAAVLGGDDATEAAAQKGTAGAAAISTTTEAAAAADMGRTEGQSAEAGSNGSTSSSASIGGGGSKGFGVGGACPLLPRMPLSLQYLISRDSYRAAAGVARALGRAARLADLQQAQPGASNLERLVQQLLDLLQAASSPHKHKQEAADASASATAAAAAAAAAAGACGGVAPAPAAGQWQCNTAAVVAVLTQVLFGASDAWQPPPVMSAAGQFAAGQQQQQQGRQHSGRAQQGASGSDAAHQQHSPKQQQQQPQQLLATDAAFEAVLLQAVAACVKPRLWSLPTSQPVGAGEVAAAGGSKQDKIPAQVLGSNALLLRCLIDAVGTTARCAGPAFSSGSSTLLRTVLLPLLERLADPCLLVSTAAAGALSSICRHTGYPLGLSQLVRANADYVVDGVCRQLRALQQHPRAPQLLAALLREAGVSAALMPLLAEPLRAALSGLSILARQQQPGNILPFLYVLQYTAAGATQEAAAARQQIQEQLQACIAQAAAAGLLQHNAADGLEGTGSDEDMGDSSEATDGLEGDTGSRDTAAARFFKQRLQQGAADPGGYAASQQSSSHPHEQQQQQHQQRHPQPQQVPAQGNQPAPPLSEVPVLPPAKKLRLAAPQLEALELSWRRALSAGSLAAAAADAATPLLLQRNLRCAVLAVQVLTAALEALAAATQAVDAEEQLFERLVDRGPEAGMKPTRPTPAKLLPAVHQMWPLLLAALQDTGSVPLLEQQLGLLARLMQLAGGKFMARRFKQDAWPLLQRLLKAGPQAGAAALAARTAASTVGGGAPAAAALLGVGLGPGSDSRHTVTSPHGARGLLTASSSGAASLGSSAAGGSSGGGSSVFGSALSSMQTSAGARGGLTRPAGAALAAGSGGGEEGPLAPATLQRVQVAVLACLAGVAGDPSAAAAVQGPLVWDVCVLAAPFLADSHALALREAAARLLVAAGSVDADAVWLLLLDLGSCYQDITQLLPAVAPSQATCGPASTSTGGACAWPTVQQLLPAVGSASSARGGSCSWCKLLHSGEAVSCGRRAAALLPRIAAAPVAWQKKAEQQLKVLQGAA